MKIEEILKNTQRLQAPESLKIIVMEAVEADSITWAPRTEGIWRTRVFRPVMVAASCAAAVLLAVWLAPGQVSPLSGSGVQESVALMEVDILLEETLEKVYRFGSMNDSAEYLMETDETRFINNNLELIFRINGGNNA